MAAKPIERYVKKQIADQGGWPRILERLSSGETVADISRTITRPDGQIISRAFFSRLLHHDEERSKAVLKARREGASAMVDDALHIADEAPLNKDAIQKARVQADLRVKVAGLIDREAWGVQKQDINVQVNVADIHLDSLRHRMIEASRPLAATLHQVLPFQGSRQMPAVETGSNGGASQACGTQELAYAKDCSEVSGAAPQDTASNDPPQKE